MRLFGTALVVFAGITVVASKALPLMDTSLALEERQCMAVS